MAAFLGAQDLEEAVGKTPNLVEWGAFLGAQDLGYEMEVLVKMLASEELVWVELLMVLRLAFVY